MAIIGNQGTPGSGFACNGANSYNQVWAQFSMPSGGGIITGLHAYFSTFTGTATCKIVVWDGSGNVLGSVDIGGVPSGSCSASGQAWRAGSPTPFYVPAGTFYMGFWCPQANGYQTSSESGGTSSKKLCNNSPCSASGGTSTTIGTLGVYADYTPGGIAHVYQTATGWQNGIVDAYDTGAWHDSQGVQAYSAGTWNQGT